MAAAAPAMVRQGGAVPASLARLVVRREAVAKLAAAVLAVASPVAKHAAAVLAVAKLVRRAAAAGLLQSAQTAPGPSSEIASTGVAGSTMHYARPRTKPFAEPRQSCA